MAGLSRPAWTTHAADRFDRSKSICLADGVVLCACRPVVERWMDEKDSHDEATSGVARIEGEWMHALEGLFS